MSTSLILKLALPLLAPVVKGLIARIFKTDGEDGLRGMLGRLLGIEDLTIPPAVQTHLNRALSAWQREALSTPDIKDDLAVVAARGLLNLFVGEGD